MKWLAPEILNVSQAVNAISVLEWALEHSDDVTEVEVGKGEDAEGQSDTDVPNACDLFKGLSSA